MTTRSKQLLSVFHNQGLKINNEHVTTKNVHMEYERMENMEVVVREQGWKSLLTQANNVQTVGLV